MSNICDHDNDYSNVIIYNWVSEWLLFNAKLEQFFSYTMAKTSCIRWNDNDVYFVLDQHV